MRVAALSDLHGHLPEIPPADLILIAGDICPYSQISLQVNWLRSVFRPWLDSLTAPVIGIAGNHDWIFEKYPDMVPPLSWTYLQDSSTHVKGALVYGTPWQPRFFDWAFNLDEPDLAKKFDMIPEGADIVVCHGPPFGILDQARNGQLTGSPSLRDKLLRIKPKLVVFGHIHEARGVYEQEGIQFANVSIVDHSYRMAHEPMVFEINL